MAKRYILTFMLISILAIGTVAIIKGRKSTGAYLADTGKSASNSFGQAKLNEILELTPGTSKAHYVTKPGPFPLVATIENDKLILDFGELKAGESNRFIDTFRIKNLSTQAITIDFKVFGEISGLIESVKLEKSQTIKANQTKSVNIKLRTTPQTTKKIYDGKLAVIIAKTSIQQDIPMKIKVYELRTNKSRPN